MSLFQQEVNQHNFQREEEEPSLPGTVWALQKGIKKSFTNRKPLLTFSSGVVFRVHPLWQIKSFTKSKDETRGSENTRAKEAEAARDQRVLQSSLGKPGSSPLMTSVTHSWAGAPTPAFKEQVLKPRRDPALGNEEESCQKAEQVNKSTLSSRNWGESSESEMHTSATSKQSRRTSALKGEAPCQVTAIWRELTAGHRSLACLTFYFIFFWVICWENSVLYSTILNSTEKTS